MARLILQFLQVTGNLRLRQEATQSTGLQPEHGGEGHPSIRRLRPRLLSYWQPEASPAGYSDTAFQAEPLRLEAATLSNPVRSAGVTKQESELWLEASTRCDHCPKLEFVCNNTTMPIYCPMLKPGNGIYNRADGSIILGTYIAPGCLKNSKEPFESLCERIRKLSSRGSEISLTIENRY